MGAAISLASATATPPEAVQGSFDADGYLKHGYAALEAGDADHAIADFDQAIGRDPNLALAYLYRGLAHASQDDNDAAIADLRTAHGLKQDWDAVDLILEEIKAVERLSKATVSAPAPAGDAPSTAVARTHDCTEYFLIFSTLMTKTGDVVVRYDVAETGAITNVGIDASSGDVWMDRAAVLCVSHRWRNTPAYRGGVAVASPQHAAHLRYVTAGNVTPTNPAH